MERYHPKLELAPRDVVARAIAREGMGSSAAETNAVYLDMRHVTNLDLHQRFPGISGFLGRHGLDLARDLIPVRPAAHYLMGGIKTDLDGRTTLTGLYAAGEAACTGVHGANRLASNSLLEGLVFGARAAKAMLADGLSLESADAPERMHIPLSAIDEELVETHIAALQTAMWTCAGLLRQQTTLQDGLAAQAECEAALVHFVKQGKSSRRLIEAHALSQVAHAILQSAMARTESRGAHARNDFPKRDDKHFRKHSVLASDGQVRFEEW
jgi:L-aspartate oxidase